MADLKQLSEQLWQRREDMARVIFPSDDYLGGYSELDAEYSDTMLAERGYEDDYPELDIDPEEYYEGYGEYVWPEMDCN